MFEQVSEFIEALHGQVQRAREYVNDEDLIWAVCQGPMCVLPKRLFMKVENGKYFHVAVMANEDVQSGPFYFCSTDCLVDWSISRKFAVDW